MNFRWNRSFRSGTYLDNSLGLYYEALSYLVDLQDNQVRLGTVIWLIKLTDLFKAALISLIGACRVAGSRKNQG